MTSAASPSRRIPNECQDRLWTVIPRRLPRGQEPFPARSNGRLRIVADLGIRPGGHGVDVAELPGVLRASRQSSSLRRILIAAASR